MNYRKALLLERNKTITYQNNRKIDLITNTLINDSFNDMRNKTNWVYFINYPIDSKYCMKIFAIKWYNIEFYNFIRKKQINFVIV